MDRAWEGPGIGVVHTQVHVQLTRAACLLHISIWTQQKRHAYMGTKLLVPIKKTRPPTAYQQHTQLFGIEYNRKGNLEPLEHKTV